MSKVALHNIRKTYGDVTVLHGIDLTFEAGEFVVVVGPSGCGKSTLLRLIAGLEEISAGELHIGGERVNDRPPSRRGIAMVFQSYALFPHLSVADNMSFGLKLAKAPKAVIKRAVDRAAEILQIGHLLDRKPKALSGGQRQRVAIGRAIVRDPKVFLFDEPLSNLDAALRVQTRIEIAKLHRDMSATMVYVTHDQVEAMTMADKIVVMRDGRVEQVGAPLELYNRPANRFVAGFIGSPKMNFVDVGVLESHEAALVLALPGGGRLTLPPTLAPLSPGQKLCLGVRPEHLQPAAEAGQETVPVTVQLAEQLGDVTLLYAHSADGTAWRARLEGQAALTGGATLHLALPAERCHVFDDQGQALALRTAPVPVAIGA